MKHGIGTLVKARGREWVVLPGSTDALLHLRPLGGSAIEETGILTSLETVESAAFELPDPSRVGDFRSCRLLRDAVRFSSRSGAGPFRSFSRIAVDPRPYQLVPLMMALRLDPVRLLIADDVGIGKTVEACLVLRELVDRGEVRRAAVLCPAPLAEQWQRELSSKFHLEAELVMPGTAARLERQGPVGRSLFERIPFTVVSMDFVKSDRRREEFLRAAPEFVIVDEAHTCARGYEGRGPRHQRHDLVSGLARADRHLVLVTATPHSGKEDAFTSLLELIDPEFASESVRVDRRRLARHLVQRRRPDIAKYLDAETPFPDREERDPQPYHLSPDYRRLFERAFAWAMETVRDETGGSFGRRVRWWSALALLRSLGSSPRAAAATLRTRAASASTETEAEADEVGIRSVMDLDAVDAPEAMDVAPGADPAAEAAEGDERDRARRRKLLEMAREAQRLEGASDPKLAAAEKQIRALVEEGFSPVVFCRFIPTAEYVAEELRRRLGEGIAVDAVTGLLPSDERERRVLALGEAGRRVLVATDCLSEGINLQESFDAVVHYDLSWNPTRHEQREGRVDRYGQPRKTVRTLLLFSPDNFIDGMVLDVLLRKHKAIRSALGISVPVPVRTEDVIEALVQGLLLRGRAGRDGQYLFPEMEEQTANVHAEWTSAADREKASRTLFAQHAMKSDEVARELEEARASAGSAADLRAFIRDALEAAGGSAKERGADLVVDASRAAAPLRDQLGDELEFTARFELPAPRGTRHIVRTHPFVSALAGYVLDSALDPLGDGIAARIGAMRTRGVGTRTTILLVRYRFDLEETHEAGSSTELCEECRLLAFSGPPDRAAWLDGAAAESLLGLKPEGNVAPELARDFASKVVEGMESLMPRLLEEGDARAAALEQSHRRVRAAARRRNVRTRVAAHRPPDVLGVYVLLPAGGAA